MSSIFQIASLKKTSFMQKMLKQYPIENAIIEVNNLLATKLITQISLDEIEAISSLYNINLQKEFAFNLQEFYAVYLNHCLKDSSLSEEEIRELGFLKMILGLSDSVIQNIHNKIGAAVYKSSFEEAVRDGRLDEKEKKFLEKLKKSIQLDEQLASKISAKTRSGFVKRFIEQISYDELLSETEEEELEAISKSLYVDVNADHRTKEQLNKFKLLWVIENKDLDEYEVDIKLQKGEICYYMDNIDWIEERRNTWTVIDRGNVYLTNKRILFMGEAKLTNIRLDKILTCTLQLNGVKIGKDTGKIPILRPKNNVDVMSKILEKLWQQV